MSSTKRNYRASFILDNRGKEDTVDQIVEGVDACMADPKNSTSATEARA